MKKDEFLKTIREDLKHAQAVLCKYTELQQQTLRSMTLTEWTSPQGQSLQRKDDYLFCAEMLLSDAIKFLSRAEDILSKDGENL